MILLARLAGAGNDQARFVGGDHGLRPVAQLRLRKYAADVRFRGLLVTVKRAATSRLDSPSPTSRRTCVSRGVSVARPAARELSARGGCLANSLMRRRVTVGASSASPAAMTRTAWNNCSAATSLSRKPLTAAAFPRSPGHFPYAIHALDSLHA